LLNFSKISAASEKWLAICFVLIVFDFCQN